MECVYITWLCDVCYLLVVHFDARFTPPLLLPSFRAPEPEDLVSLQTSEWDPVVSWFNKRYVKYCTDTASRDDASVPFRVSYRNVHLGGG